MNGPLSSVRTHVHWTSHSFSRCQLNMAMFNWPPCTISVELFFGMSLVMRGITALGESAINTAVYPIARSENTHKKSQTLSKIILPVTKIHRIGMRKIIITDWKYCPEILQTLQTMWCLFPRELKFVAITQHPISIKLSEQHSKK